MRFNRIFIARDRGSDPILETIHSPSGKLSNDSLLFVNRIYFFTLAFLLILEIVCAVVVGWRVFRKSPIEVYADGGYFALAPMWCLIPLIWLGAVAVQLAKRRVRRPTAVLLRLLRTRRGWLVRGAAVLLSYVAMAQSFTVLKSAIPAIVPFYLDPPLADLDKALLGADAWEFARRATPEWTMIASDRVYILWFTYVILVIGVVAFTRRLKVQMQATLALHLCFFGLGAILATGLASVGPVFYDMTYGGDRFAPLLKYLADFDRHIDLVAIITIQYLIDNAGSIKLGVGISAMPSLHVGMSYFGFLLAKALHAARPVTLFTAAFTVATLFASVRLGWHYLSDGLVGIVLVMLVWRASGWLVNWSTNRRSWHEA